MRFSRWRGIYGAKIDDLGAIDAMGIDRSRLARTLAQSYLSMVFVDGFFHADPHPGNFFVEADGRLAMVDFGMTGTVAPQVRRALVEILLALSTRDVHRTLLALRELSIVPPGVDEQGFSLELEGLTSLMVDVPVGEMRLALLLSHFMTVSRRHRLCLPRELALLMKTIVMCEALAAQLDPAFFSCVGHGPVRGRRLRDSQKRCPRRLNGLRDPSIGAAVGNQLHYAGYRAWL